MTLKENILQTLHHEVKIALGCTEPVAIALVVAHATVALDGEVKKIRVGLSPNIYKNALNVGIPGTSFIGLETAAALGVFCDSEKKLTLLKELKPQDISKSQELVDAGSVEIYVLDTEERIFLKAEVYSTDGYALAEIKGKHDQLTKLMKNTLVLFEGEASQEKKIDNSIYKTSLKMLIECVETLSYDETAFLIEGIEMNIKAAKIGLELGSGLGLGQKMQTAISKGYLGMDLANETFMMSAAASDARMSGEDVEIMTSNGSGNNGIAAIIPLAVYAKYSKVSEEKLAKAIAISHLVNGKIKNAIGRLSPMCACGVAAATGASAGLVYLMSGDFNQMENSVQAMLSDLSGMICDGAKIGCSLKLATSASTAVQTAILAKEGLVLTKGNGILGVTADESIANLGRIALEGMHSMDQTILSIITH